MKSSLRIKGNHEFDYGVSTFVDRFMGNITENGTPSLPILAANIDASEEPKLDGLFTKSATFMFDNVKIGVVGFITEDTVEISSK